MANEVTINIESSLAAMAFVVADQQQIIKELREKNGRLENQCENLRNAAIYESTELHKEIDELTQDCQDRLGIISKKETDIKNLKDNYNDLYDTNIDICKQVDELKKKVLEWHTLQDEPLPMFPRDEYQFTPCVLLKMQIMKEGWYYNNGKPIPVGTIYIEAAGLYTEGQAYKIQHTDPTTSIIAWCIAGESNM